MKLVLALLLASNVAAADPLTVVIKPAKLTWKQKQSVEVVLTVSNASNTKQSMKVMSCSWEDHWKSNDTELAWESWGCDKNAAMTVELEPGKAREWKLPMFATAKAKLGAHRLAMTFTPEGLAPTKSNTVTIKVTR